MTEARFSMDALLDSMNALLDLKGPDFLWLYVGLLAVGMILALTARWFFRQPGGKPWPVLTTVQRVQRQPMVGVDDGFCPSPEGLRGRRWPSRCLQRVQAAFRSPRPLAHRPLPPPRLLRRPEPAPSPSIPATFH